MDANQVVQGSEIGCYFVSYSIAPQIPPATAHVWGILGGLGCSWVILGQYWGIFGRSKAMLEPSWRHLGPKLGHLFLGRLRDILGP
jgi:hypothetical protein